MKFISSPKNEEIKVVKELRENPNYYWWEGIKFFLEIIKEKPDLKYLILTENIKSIFDKELTKLSMERTLIVSEKVFEKLSFTKTPQGIGGIIKKKHWKLDDILNFEGPLFFLDGLQDPGNVGTIIRIADAFGFNGVIYKKNGVSPYNEKAVRSSTGSILRVPCYCIEDKEIEKISQSNKEIFFLDTDIKKSTDIRLIPVEKLRKGIFFLGKEGTGLETELERGQKIFIPINKSVDSLNVAVTAGIVGFLAGSIR